MRRLIAAVAAHGANPEEDGERSGAGRTRMNRTSAGMLGALMLVLAACGAGAADTSTPVGGVTAAFETARSGGLLRQMDFFACMYAGSSGNFSSFFGGLSEEAIAASGVDPDEFMAVFSTSFDDFEATEASRSGDQATVHLTVNVTLAADMGKLRQILKQYAEAQGLQIDDAMIDAAVARSVGELPRSQVLEHDMNVALRDGAWLACEGPATAAEPSLDSASATPDVTLQPTTQPTTTPSPSSPPPAFGANGSNPAGGMTAYYEAAKSGSFEQQADFVACVMAGGIHPGEGGGLSAVLGNLSELGRQAADSGELSDVFSMSFDKFAVSESSLSGDQATVHVSFEATLDADLGKARELLRRLAEDSGATVDDASLDAEVERQFGVFPYSQVLTHDVNVVHRGGSWSACGG